MCRGIVSAWSRRGRDRAAEDPIAAGRRRAEEIRALIAVVGKYVDAAERARNPVDTRGADHAEARRRDSIIAATEQLNPDCAITGDAIGENTVARAAIYGDAGVAI